MTAFERMKAELKAALEAANEAVYLAELSIKTYDLDTNSVEGLMDAVRVLNSAKARADSCAEVIHIFEFHENAQKCYANRCREVAEDMKSAKAEFEAIDEEFHAAKRAVEIAGISATEDQIDAATNLWAKRRKAKHRMDKAMQAMMDVVEAVANA